MTEKNIIPLIRGDFADPTVVKFHGKYYMTHMKVTYPCALIWESEDLIHWEPLSIAAPMFGRMAAPELNVFRDTAFLYVTAHGKNYVLTSKDMLHWSQPALLGVGTIDPGYVYDRETGRQYLYFADGHAFALGEDGMPVEDLRKIYDGWEFPEEWDAEGRLLLESPKLFYRAPYYYMVSAQGGTAGPPTSHMCVVARSHSPIGPWENSPYNPLVHCDSEQEQWWVKGHGTVLEGPAGQWWVIYHTYENGHMNLGRQTVMQPVKWLDDGWFVVDESKDFTQIRPEHPPLSDDFQAETLGWQWGFLDPLAFRDAKVGAGKLTLCADGEIVEQANLCMLRPMDHEFTADVFVKPSPGAIGMLLYCYPVSYRPWLYTGCGFGNGKLYFWNGMDRAQREYPLAEKTEGIYLRMQKCGQTLRFSFSTDRTHWNKLERTVDVSGYHHNVVGGYAAPCIALGAMQQGEAVFQPFVYQNGKELR